MLAALGVLCILVPEAALATTQFSDILYLDGQKQSLVSLPLEPYYGPGIAPFSAQHRHLAVYIATWEIDQVSFFKGHPGLDENREGLEALFLGSKARWPQSGSPASSRSPG
jgi:hypothetical protein